MLQQANYGRLLEPGLRKIFFETYKEKPEQFSQVFKVQTSNKAVETDLRVGGFGLWDKKDSAGSVKFQDPTGTQPIQYIHEEFSSGFSVERKLIDDEQYNVINKFPANLARAARATVETQAATFMNNAFSTNLGIDNQPLISATHQRLDGGYMSNQLGIYVDPVAGTTTNGTAAAPQFGGVANGALSDRNLKAALIQASQQVDDHGILIECTPTVLVVPRVLEYKARTILESMSLSPNGDGTLASGVSNATNEKNLLRGNFKVVVWDYLTSATAWFVMDPTIAELNFFWRKKLEFANESDFATMQWKYRGYMRFTCGASDFRGIVGSLGTGAA